MYQNDQSNNIVVRDTTINTFGSECFNVKENAHHNRLENSECGYNDEPSTYQGSNVEFRGDHNIVLATRVTNSRSWNLKLASDTAADDLGGNTAQGSTFSGAATYAIINRQTGSGPFCGNTITGSASDPSGNSVGSPTSACSGATTPAVTARTPATDANGVAAGSNVTATFSEAVQGVSGTTFTLKAGSTTVGATVGYDGTSRTATLDPAADLAANTQYTATLTTGIKGATGTPLANTTWTFTTAGAPADTTAPAVTARTPAENATGVAVGSNVTATFSEAVQGWSNTTFTLKAGTTGVGAAVTYNASTRVLTLDPTANLAANTVYTAELTGGAAAIRDSANNPLATGSWTFTTAATAPPPDTTAPTVTARTPTANVTGVAVGSDVTATFSEAVQGFGTTTFTLKPGTSSSATSVAAVVSYDAATRVATLNPSANLASNTLYTARLTGGTSAVRDMANNALANTSWTFTTAPPPDTTAPTVTSRSPSSNATGVSRTGNITATFSEAVSNVVAADLSNPGTFTLRTGTTTGTGTAVTASVRRNGTSNQWILDPTSTLAARTTYTVTLTGGASGIKDAAGNPLATISWSFRTS
jgi:methionine-rich copper-binding protein CopC